MDFSRRKLPKEAALNLRICPIASVKPYALMLAPVYVFMRINEKFVSIKGPLDFFTPEELERLKSFESFYLPEFVDAPLNFRQTARHVRALVGWQPERGGEQQLPPAPYEMSDAIIRMLGSLWGAGLTIEPFFAAVFANELCDLLPTDLLLAARERSIEAYERAILKSGWAVFLALHLGYCDLPFLNQLRTRVFEQTMNGAESPMPSRTSEVDELVEIVFESLDQEARAQVSGEFFFKHPGRAAKKLAARLERVRSDNMIREDLPVPTIYGEGGLPMSHSFGKNPPRSIETFGVAGLLGEQAKVFYSSLFTTKHVGRVSDLIAAKLQDEGLDELRLRALLLFGAFEVFRARVDSNEEISRHRLAEPLVIECGVDEDKIAVGVSFTAEEDRFPALGGLSERMEQDAPKGAFEALLREIHRHADRTVVRAQEGIRRVELVALIGIPGRIDPAELDRKPPVEVIAISELAAKEPPPVESYIELGDLDYPELLRENAPGASAPPPATGEILIHGCTEVEEAFRIRAEKLLEDMTGKKISGGNVTALNDEVIRVGGAEFAEREESQITVRSSELPPASTVMRRQELHDEDPEDDTEAEVDESSQNTLQELIKKVRGFWASGARTGDQAMAVADDEIEDVAEEDAEADAEDEGDFEKADPKLGAARPEEGEEEMEGQAPSPLAEVEAKLRNDSESNVEAAADNLASEIQSGIERAINKAKGEVDEFRKEMGTPRAKRWVDGLMSELVAEKSRLHDAAKRLNSSIRQKELDFRNKEQMLMEELRRSDEQIRLKNNALSRAKDQLAQAQMSAGKAKSGKSGSEEAHYKQKYVLVQKMLSSAKDENAALTQKVEDLKGQLMNAQLSSSKRNQPSIADFTALQAKYERAVRQGDEFKKSNQQMMEKLSESKRERGSGNQEAELKKRLDSAMKAAVNHQKEAERLSLKVEEMQREQLRMQGELNRANNELKAARTGKGTGKAMGQGTAQPGTSGGKSNPPKAA